MLYLFCLYPLYPHLGKIWVYLTAVEWDGRWFHCLRQGAEQQDRVWQPGRVPLPSQKQSSQGTPGAAAALGIRHLPGNWNRTLALKWGLLPNCTTRRWLTHPPGNGGDMRYCGQNRGFLAVVPAADCFDAWNAILLSLFFFFFFLQRGSLSSEGSHLGPKWQEPSPSRLQSGCGCCSV